MPNAGFLIPSILLYLLGFCCEECLFFTPFIIPSFTVARCRQHFLHPENAVRGFVPVALVAPAPAAGGPLWRAPVWPARPSLPSGMTGCSRLAPCFPGEPWPGWGLGANTWAVVGSGPPTPRPQRRGSGVSVIASESGRASSPASLGVRVHLLLSVTEGLSSELCVQDALGWFFLSRRRLRWALAGHGAHLWFFILPAGLPHLDFILFYFLNR